MNKQELIEKYKTKGEVCKEFPVVAISDVLKDLRELDELQKVKIPQFVADWIEEAKKSCKDVSDLFDFDFTNEEVGNWFLQEKPFDLVARAWLDGYEVEKEPKYIVKLKNGQPLVKAPLGGKFYFNQNITAGNYKATRKELEEAGFGWVFDCEGIEVEEVE